MSSVGQHEWVILFVVLIGVLVWELVRTRRAIRQAAANNSRDGRLPTDHSRKV